MATLLAAANARQEIGTLPLVALGVALLLGTVLAYRVYRDIRGGTDERLTGPNDLLDPVLKAYTSGQMSQEEYLRARDAVARAGQPSTEPILPPRPTLHSGGTGATPAADSPAGESPPTAAEEGIGNPSPADGSMLL